jgi:hypothetical protein
MDTHERAVRKTIAPRIVQATKATKEKPMESSSEGPSKPQQHKGVFDEIRVTGENLLKTIRELIHEGNYRRISIRNDEGQVLIEIPLAVGLVGALFAPVWAAVGAMAAMATGFSIIVERQRPEPKDVNKEGDGGDKNQPSA